MTIDDVRDELAHLRDDAAVLLEAYLARPLLRGVSHALGFITAIAAMVVLIVQAAASVQVVASAIYGAGLTLALGTSALYHRIKWRPAAYHRIRKLDHSMIYVLIASSCTPFALVLLDGSWRIIVLSVMWGLAAIGIALRWLIANQPRWLQVGSYIAMGWAGLLLLPALDKMGPTTIVLTAVGGVLYTIGGLVYLFQRPNPLPKIFGFHEVFHALVVAAATCHFLAVWPLVTTPGL
ncbi:MAG: hemolysin III family protein [Thermoleophilia bacterium]|nr:hemolysin III family protein [Thermoleophilia bacterium]